MVNTETTSNVAPTADRITGLVAEFETVGAVMAAAERMRDEGYRDWDVHSPFPIHGIEKRMGIRMTILPFLVLAAGFAGAVVALLLQWYANAYDYPLIISGKPLFSLPANIPVTFELIVLFSALTAFGGSLALSLLPQFHHPAFSVGEFVRVSDDRFFISVEAIDKQFDETATRELLTSLGAGAVQTCRAPDRKATLPKAIWWGLAVLCVLAFFPPLLTALKRAAPSATPRVQFIKDMDSQPSFKPQTVNPFFADARSSRPNVPGAIAQGQLHADAHLETGQVDGSWVGTFPDSIPQTMFTMKRGREQFRVYCAPCHGLAGDGDGMIARRAMQRMDPNWRPPTQLFAPNVLEQPLGQIYGTITHGKGIMPAYEGQIATEDRWAIVMYVKALQRSRTAPISDVPENERAKLIQAESTPAESTPAESPEDSK